MNKPKSIIIKSDQEEIVLTHNFNWLDTRNFMYSDDKGFVDYECIVCGAWLMEVVGEKYTHKSSSDLVLTCNEILMQQIIE